MFGQRCVISLHQTVKLNTVIDGRLVLQYQNFVVFLTQSPFCVCVVFLQVFGTDVMVTVAKSFEAPIKRKQPVLWTVAENPHHGIV